LDSGDTLLTILGDILDFSKIDHNSMVLESAPVWPPSHGPLHLPTGTVLLPLQLLTATTCLDNAALICQYFVSCGSVCLLMVY
jgi:signal transduction histidine kinase